MANDWVATAVSSDVRTLDRGIPGCGKRRQLLADEIGEAHTLPAVAAQQRVGLCH